MRASSTNPSTADLVDGTLAATAGVGVVTLALFPLAIPILALTVVALIPLLIPLLLIAPRRGIDRGAVPAARVDQTAPSLPHRSDEFRGSARSVRPNTQIRLSCQTLNANGYLSEPLNRALSTRPPKEA